MKKQLTNSLIVALLLMVSVIGFNACKKKTREIPDPNEKYKRELKTYHESQDYKNLLIQYPNQKFVDLQIFDANDKMKAIVTNIISNSDEIVRAITHFQPAGDFNTWYPTFVIHMKAEVGKDLTTMVKNKMFSGSIEMKLTNNTRMNMVLLKDNKNMNTFTNQQKNVSSELNRNISSSKIVMNLLGLTACLRAVNACVDQELEDMGWIAYASCFVTAPACIAIITADCLLHERECIGIPKHL